MSILFKEHQELIKALNRNNVQFMVIGGYSVIYYGYRRTTGDLDLWIKPDNDNKNLLIKALLDFGFEEEDVRTIQSFDFTDYLVFSIGKEPLKVDFLTRINTVEYENADLRKIFTDIDGIRIPIIHKEDLILSKFNTGRDKDKADIGELQKIERLRNKE